MHDGRICFLDFGLMDRVSPRVMEGFADGIRSVVSQNWTALAHSMQVVEFVPDPVKRSLELMETPRKNNVYHSIYVVYMIYDICIYNYSMLLQML
jgi:predicted unusual protein kinase regulating ubiquinone biosynthesis (AarF/ABC1/UbiB family)